MEGKQRGDRDAVLTPRETKKGVGFLDKLDSR